MYSISIKSGTNGWYNEDDCDMGVARINSNNIPKVGDIIGLEEKDGFGEYLVTEIKRHIYGYNKKEDDSEYDDASFPIPDEYITVYVLNMSYYGQEEYKKKYQVLQNVLNDLIEFDYITNDIYKELYQDARDKVYGY